MKQGKMKIASPVLIVAAVGAVFWVNAGDLNPPPGAIMPTDRVTINQQNTALPYIITSPGSYVLTSNLIAVPGHTGDGISILSDDVSLDLNGFSVVGVPGSTDGINLNTHSNIQIRNGIVRDWGANGLGGGSAESCRLTDINAYNNGSNGIQFSNSTVLTQCVSSGNGSSGFRGFKSTLSNCTASDNGGDGFRVSTSTFSHCIARQNLSRGFWGGNLFDHCAATANGSDGFITDSGTLVRDCIASSNGGSGIAAFRSRVDGCVSTSNDEHGIKTSSWRCTIVNNHCGDNILAGIFVPSNGVGSRIHNNHVLDNNIGIDVDGVSTFITGNTAYNNTTVDFSFLGLLNQAGPIHTSSGTPTSPWANFSQ